MLKDLTKREWLTILNLPESRVPGVLILRGTRNFRLQYRAMRPWFANVLDLGTPNGITEDVLIGDVRGCTIGFACVYGASMASEIVHLFGRLGTRAVLQIGNCGALADGLTAGDLFLAERAWCGEGAARYYKQDATWVEASTQLLLSETVQQLPAGAYRTGAIYSTAALFAEGAADLERWFADGFAAVDLETAATYAVAESFGMDRLSILYVFDNPRRQDHLLLSDPEKADRRARADLTMKQLALDLAVDLCERYGARKPASADGLLIRDCRADEADALLALWQQSSATISQTDTVPDLRRAIVDSPAIVLVVERQGRLIGSIIGSFDGWRGNIYRLVVQPEYRRQGIARALVSEVEKRLSQQGAQRITALVETDHADATGFWTAAGYRRDPRITRFVRNL